MELILASFTRTELPKFSYPQPCLKGLVIVQSLLYLCQTGIWYIHLSKCITDGANSLCIFSCIQACITGILRNVIPVVRVEILYVEGSQQHNSCMKKVYSN